jgi:hypothetical protein
MQSICISYESESPNGPTPQHFRRKWNSSIDCPLTTKEYDSLIYLAEHAVFFDYIDSCFIKAVETIKNESLVGIDVKTTNFGHHYEVTLLSISTQTCVYQFDILKLGMAAFDTGLQSIFESKIQKVIHNSRLSSSCLYHKYSVRLDNVFDTQAGELMIEKNLCGNFPKYVCSLPECMQKFLGIPPRAVQFNEDYRVMWMKRPLSQSLKFAAAQDAIFVLPLQESIMAKMFAPLMQGIKIFLEKVRDAQCDEAAQHIGMNHLVPQEFLELECASNES